MHLTKHRTTPLRRGVACLAGAAAEGRFTGEPLTALLQNGMALEALADQYPLDTALAAAQTLVALHRPSYIWDDGRVTVFRRPSSNANGNAFDFQGRLLSCEDFTRRLIRWEHDGTMTVIADSYDGKPLNSPNGVAPHPDGSIWFTDPGYGDQIAEGHPDEAGGPANRQGILNPRVGAPDAGVIGGRKRELPTNTYRWEPSGKLEVVAAQEELPDPNGLCFSPDHKTFYLISTDKGPGDTVAGRRSQHLCLRRARHKTHQQAAGSG